MLPCSWGSNDFEVDLQVQEGLPNVMGDLPALSQCLQNLITNAVKYSGKNRWIRHFSIGSRRRDKSMGSPA